MKEVVLAGISGHSLVVADAFIMAGWKILGYLNKTRAVFNPYNLEYLGFELDESIEMVIKNWQVFPAMGDNKIRKSVFNVLLKTNCKVPTILHPTSVVSSFVELGNGTIICANATINSFAKIGSGVIANTASVIEHECAISDFVHVAPGAVLAGNVTIGQGTFIGANSVVRQGVIIGQNVIVGAGSVVLHNVPDNVTVVGNPAKILVK